MQTKNNGFRCRRERIGNARQRAVIVTDQRNNGRAPSGLSGARQEGRQGMSDVYQRPAIARHFRTRPAQDIAASVICGESLPAAARGGAGRDDRASIRRGMRLIFLYRTMIRVVMRWGKKV